MTYRSDIEALAARKVALDAEIKQRTKERDEAETILKDAVQKLRLTVLDNVRVAAPCKASWSKMKGDDRVRHCTRCDQQVFDLSSMTRDEAEALIRDKHGKLCARYFTRADGTIITKDCPEGQRRRSRGVAIALGAFGALASLAGIRPFATQSDLRPTMGSIGAMPSSLPDECQQYQEDINALDSCDAIPEEAVRTLRSAWISLDVAAEGIDDERLERMKRVCNNGRDDLARMRETMCPTADSEHRDRDRSRDGDRKQGTEQ